jgi:hypothetical protein
MKKRPYLQLVRNKPRTYTSAEAVLDSVREGIFMDGRTHKEIARLSHISPTTVRNIAVGNTTWPRHTTLFPIMHTLGMQIHIQMPEEKKE